MSDTATPTEYLVQRIGGSTLLNAEPMAQWLNDRANEGWHLICVSDGVCYFDRPLTEPKNINVPMVSLVSDTQLHCTMGEWTGHPTTYAYAWKMDGAAVGTDAPDYSVDTAADAGKEATCVVTATNQVGATTAPPSNAVTVPGERREASGRQDQNHRRAEAQQRQTQESEHRSEHGRATNTHDTRGSHQGQGSHR